MLLIMAQNPEASQVAGFHTWRTLGRYVKAGEKGIAILAPMLMKRDQHDASDSSPPEDSEDRLVRFKVAYVFDVSQTDGEPLPDFA
ncbi:ArdC family protein, partial [Acinetobacter baumannii]